MTQLIQLRQKIKSIDTTKKITHAIRLVSMSLYSRLEKNNKALNYYKNSLTEVFNTIKTQIPEWNNPRLSPEDILDSTPLFIIISSSRGLCGSFNSNLFRYIQRSLLLEEHQNPSFICIGNKAYKFLQEKNLGKIIKFFPELNSNNFVSISKDISENILTCQCPFSSVSFFSNQLKNFFIQKPSKTTIIPLQKESENKEQKEKLFIDFIWEQDPDLIATKISETYLNNSILNTIFQSLLSEQAARFIAMDSSTNNAEKILEKLNLQYNKARQTLITKEVAELSAGSLK